MVQPLNLQSALLHHVLRGPSLRTYPPKLHCQCHPHPLPQNLRNLVQSTCPCPLCPPNKIRDTIPVPHSLYHLQCQWAAHIPRQSLKTRASTAAVGGSGTDYSATWIVTDDV